MYRQSVKILSLTIAFKVSFTDFRRLPHTTHPWTCCWIENPFYVFIIHVFLFLLWASFPFVVGSKKICSVIKSNDFDNFIMAHKSKFCITSRDGEWSLARIISTSFTPHFSVGLVKAESDFIVRSVEAGLGRWALVVAVIRVDAHPFMTFLDLTFHLEDTGVHVFWLHCASL